MSSPRNPEHDEARLLELLWILGPDHIPLHPKTFAQWAEAQVSGVRIVGFDVGVGWELSTVFLGIDHGCSMITGGKPRLFETAIFWPDRVQILGRWRSWEDAEKAHANALNDLMK